MKFDLWVLLFIFVVVCMSLYSTLTKSAPGCAVPPGTVCTRSEDPGVGGYWICGERVR